MRHSCARPVSQRGKAGQVGTSGRRQRRYEHDWAQGRCLGRDFDGALSCQLTAGVCGSIVVMIRVLIRRVRVATTARSIGFVVRVRLGGGLEDMAVFLRSGVVEAPSGDVRQPHGHQCDGERPTAAQLLQRTSSHALCCPVPPFVLCLNSVGQSSREPLLRDARLDPSRNTTLGPRIWPVFSGKSGRFVSVIVV